MHPPSSRLLSSVYSWLAPASLFLLIPLLSRWSLNWQHPYGYLSDLAFGLVLFMLCRGRPRWFALPLMLLWVLCQIGSLEMIEAVGRMPELNDLRYLADPQFIGNSTAGSSGGLSQPLTAAALLLALLLSLLHRPQPQERAPNWLLALPAALLTGHAASQWYQPSEVSQWQQFNLPHKWLAESLSRVQLTLEEQLDGTPETEPDIGGLTQLDLDGRKLVADRGQARNVLIITLEGIPGAYISTNRTALNVPGGQPLMPKLSSWAERGMSTPDYVLHSHQTIRGLYAMLCGDYSKLDSGTPKGVELLNNSSRSRQCLPAQLRQRGFSTHFLQGAGLRFMAKDKIMPQMGFQKTLGRDWFRNKPNLEFPWGMDDKAYFEGALGYVKQLRRQRQPWMLTLLTVGTHQPYSAPEEYLQRYPDGKQAAVAYLDDAIDNFLGQLEQMGVLKNTLVIVTSDESHGIDNVRLASAWGLNLILAPEQDRLPALKGGVYGHVDLTTSVLDYFGLPVPGNLIGRSLFRDYDSGRPMISYTNGLLRLHDGQETFSECDFQQVCRRYRSEGFIAADAEFLGRFRGREARLISRSAALLDQSLQGGQAGQQYQFATRERIRLKDSIHDDWADNLIGAQYLEMPSHSRTTVTLKIRPLKLDRAGARLLLKTKEYDRDISLAIPSLPLLKPGQPLELSFDFANEKARKAFSFHLLAEGHGAIEITDFSVTTLPIEVPTLEEPAPPISALR